MEVRTLTFDDERWKMFVDSFPGVNIFHSPEMMRVFSLSEGFEVLPLFAMDAQEVVAAAFPVMVKINYPLPGKFKNRVIMYASPLYRPNAQGREGVDHIMQHLEDGFCRKALFLEIRNSEKFPGDAEIARLKGYEYIPYQNYLLSLKEGADALLKSFSTFTRNHIRKAEKKSCVIREIADPELDTVVELIEHLYRRKKVPVINRTVFFNAYAVLRPHHQIRAIVAELDSKIIAARISLNYGHTVYDWYAASDPEFNNCFPNEALAWDTMRWGCDNGYHLFDFGGGAVRGQYYGPAKFKEKFKGELVEYGRYRFTRQKLLYGIARKLYELRTSRTPKK